MEADALQITIEAIQGNIDALNATANRIGEIGKATDAVGVKQQSLSTTFKRSWTEINSAIAVVSRAYREVEKAVDATVGAFVDYAGQVRTITQVTGASAESVSALLQVTDDYKIKAESLTVVMKKMATEGFDFTVDSIADLSDEYLKLNPGVERQIFLNEKFGRQGVDFAEIMLAGGKAIREKSEAVQAGLILDQEALDQARALEIAQDDLNDSWEALTITIGRKAVPALADWISGLNDLLSGEKNLFEAGIDFWRQTDDATKSVDGLKQSFRDISPNIAEVGKGVDGLTKNFKDFSSELDTIISGAQMFDDQNELLEGSIKDMKAAETAYMDYKRANPLDTAGIAAMRQAWEDMGTAVEDVQAANEEQTKTWIANILLQQLSLGPEGLSGAEMAFYLQYMTNNGLMSDASAALAQKLYDDTIKMAGGFDTATAAAEGTKEALKNIPAETKANIEYTEKGRSKLDDYKSMPKDKTGSGAIDYSESGRSKLDDFKGMPLSKAAKGSISYVEINSLIKEAYNNMKDKNVTVTTTYVTNGDGGNYTPATPMAGGGKASAGRWAMVGEAGTEYVYANQGGGFTVYNQSQMAGKSAPPMAGGGTIPSPDGDVNLSQKSVRDLADALAYKLAPFL